LLIKTLGINSKFYSLIVLTSFLLLLDKDIAIRFFVQPIYNADAIGNLLGLIGLIFWLRYLQSEKRRDLLWMSGIWSIAAYFRLTWYTFLFAVLTLIFVVACWKTKSWLNKKILSNILLSILLFLTITAPWRIYAYEKMDISPEKWTQFQAVILLEQWYPKEVWKDTWIANTGAYPLCEIDPTTCHEVINLRAREGSIANSKIYKLTIRTWITHFPALIMYESPYILKGILSPPENFTPDRKLHFTLFNLASVFSWILILGLLTRFRKKLNSFVLPIITFLAVHVGFLYFFHTENRYLLVFSFAPFIILPYFASILKQPGLDSKTIRGKNEGI